MNHALGRDGATAKEPLSHDAAATKAPLAGLSREEINQLPIRAWEGSVIVVRDAGSLESALADLWKEKIIGFDTETKPTFTKGQTALPALVQLASGTCVYLIQLMHVPFGPALAELLSCPGNAKVGVAIHDDIKALNRHYPFAAAGVVDLAAMARQQGIQAQGLRTLAANLLGFRISKGAQCSNWENPVLTLQQIRYAATDAWVGREIYLHLERRRAKGTSRPSSGSEDLR